VRAAQPAVADQSTQRRVLDAFTAAAQRGDFEALVAVLDPEVTLRADAGPGGLSIVLQGAAEVASRAVAFRQTGVEQVRVLVNGVVGLLSVRDGRPVSVFSPVIRDGRIVEINILADPERLARLDLGDVLSAG
jgi:RNA polymerase sigma-70 factor (ECF subfamily)